MATIEDRESRSAADMREEFERLLERALVRRRRAEGVDRWASVALILRPDEGVSALFVQRAEVDGDPWSGHMALPGGRQDPDDADLWATAVREVREETGLKLTEADRLGRLDDVRPSTRRLPSIAVAAFVAWLDRPPALNLNHELDSHLWLPLDTLRDPSVRHAHRIDRRPGVTYPSIQVAGRTIWGLTYRIVESFLRALDPPADDDGPPRQSTAGGPLP